MENLENESVKPVFNDDSVVTEGKTIAIVAYITLIGLLIAIILNNDKKNSFAAFHIRQGLGIGFSGLVVGMLGMILLIIPFLGWLIYMASWILIFVMWISGFLNALNGKEKPVPVLGDKFQEWFKGIG